MPIKSRIKKVKVWSATCSNPDCESTSGARIFSNESRSAQENALECGWLELPNGNVLCSTCVWKSNLPIRTSDEIAFIESLKNRDGI
jgi:hypothetical protein